MAKNKAKSKSKTNNANKPNGLRKWGKPAKWDVMLDCMDHVDLAVIYLGKGATSDQLVAAGLDEAAVGVAWATFSRKGPQPKTKVHQLLLQCTHKGYAAMVKHYNDNKGPGMPATMLQACAERKHPMDHKVVSRRGQPVAQTGCSVATWANESVNVSIRLEALAPSRKKKD